MDLNKIHELTSSFDSELGKKIDYLVKDCFKEMRHMISHSTVLFDPQRTIPSLMHDIFKTRISREIYEGKFPGLFQFENGKKFYMVYKESMLIDFSIANDKFLTSASSCVSKDFDRQKPLENLDIPHMIHAHLCYNIDSSGLQVSTTAIAIPKNAGSNLHIKILSEGAAEFENFQQPEYQRETPLQKLNKRRRPKTREVSANS